MTPSILPLRLLAYARARVSGSAVVVCVALRDPAWWHVVRDAADAARVQAWFGAFRPTRVARRELPGIATFHFVLEEAAGAGRGHDLAGDPAARGLAQRLLDMPVSVPSEMGARFNLPSPPPLP
ncbi:MAG: hypothetical protein JNL71_12495 [Rhodospirillales bacterium]|nr:hypothetical protein [Rhodospirillales bacterium]